MLKSSPNFPVIPDHLEKKILSLPTDLALPEYGPVLMTLDRLLDNIKSKMMISALYLV